MAIDSRAEQLALQRITLQLRCALQRQEIAHLTENIESRLSGADRITSIAGGLVRNPLVVVTLVAGTMFIGPWRLFKWISQGTMYFGLARSLLQFLKR